MVRIVANVTAKIKAGLYIKRQLCKAHRTTQR